MPDSRIKEFTDEYFKCFEVKYGFKPMWSGKFAKRTQDMWGWVDKNAIDVGKIYSALHNFFSDDGFVKEQGHALELFFKSIHKYMQPAKKTPEQNGKDIVEKARAMFMDSQKRIEERMIVEPKNQESLLNQFSKLYPAKDHETALRWAKGHRYTFAQSDLVKDQSSLIYKRWVDHGKLARLYFGDDLISKVWSDTKPSTTEDRKEMLKKQIKDLTTNIDKVG
jgi:hypothetical protein